MQYRTTPRIEDELSLIGYGCMRFSKKGVVTDQEKAEREMTRALELGVNYFDTAYIYPGSEEALGKFAAKNGNRERMLIATKMPHYMCKSLADFDRIFEEQLRRLQTDHVDYYLMHMLTNLGAWERLVEMGVPEWVERRKAAGQIRHIGFSYHGGREDFPRIVDAYEWEFVQIQLNYLDAGSQAGLDGLFHAASRQLPVIIMEPLRGGKLAADLPGKAKQVFKAADPDMSLAAWSLQWLFDLPEVTCVLSGMNDISQVEENCEIASRVQPNSLTPEQDAVYDQAIAEIRAVEKVPCTGCGYCMPCPKGIDIPTCFRSYNTRFTEGWMAAQMNHIQSTMLSQTPASASLCVNCGRCMKHCPQHINIPAELRDVEKTLEGPVYRIGGKLKGLFWRG